MRQWRKNQDFVSGRGGVAEKRYCRRIGWTRVTLEGAVGGKPGRLSSQGIWSLRSGGPEENSMGVESREQLRGRRKSGVCGCGVLYLILGSIQKKGDSSQHFNKSRQKIQNLFPGFKRQRQRVVKGSKKPKSTWNQQRMTNSLSADCSVISAGIARLKELLKSRLKNKTRERPFKIQRGSVLDKRGTGGRNRNRNWGYHEMGMRREIRMGAWECSQIRILIFLPCYAIIHQFVAENSHYKRALLTLQSWWGKQNWMLHCGGPIWFQVSNVIKDQGSPHRPQSISVTPWLASSSGIYLYNYIITFRIQFSISDQPQHTVQLTDFIHHILTNHTLISRPIRIHGSNSHWKNCLSQSAHHPKFLIFYYKRRASLPCHPSCAKGSINPSINITPPPPPHTHTQAGDPTFHSHTSIHKNSTLIYSSIPSNPFIPLKQVSPLLEPYIQTKLLKTGVQQETTHFGLTTHRMLQSWSRLVAEPIFSTQMGVAGQIPKMQNFLLHYFFWQRARKKNYYHHISPQCLLGCGSKGGGLRVKPPPPFKITQFSISIFLIMIHSNYTKNYFHFHQFQLLFSLDDSLLLNQYSSLSLRQCSNSAHPKVFKHPWDKILHIFDMQNSISQNPAYASNQWHTCIGRLNFKIDQCPLLDFLSFHSPMILISTSLSPQQKSCFLHFQTIMISCFEPLSFSLTPLISLSSSHLFSRIHLFKPLYFLHPFLFFSLNKLFQHENPKPKKRVPN
ncbi:hypothetical protein VP01_2370g1 [Puccinia sorghi]|uniref:Uncharacterized protein n=1 Tax=Puccinia sorghi TaxID=27349 RepID=A0A0L6V709_9BASI|nr:hypothetical protein VP01_2370g1 [Puccinia sorghi]